MPEVVVIGAGVIGSSTAFHLAESGVDVRLVDPTGGFGGQTPRSGAIIRGHHVTALEAGLAWESLANYFESWADRVGGSCGFTGTGFAYLANETDETAARGNVAMLRAQGFEAELLSPAELAEVEPAVSTEDVAVAAYERRSGYADPTATTLSLLNGMRRHGGRLEQRRALELTEKDGAITGVRTEGGTLHADCVVLAAGAWSAELAATVGLELPIQTARIQVMLYERPYELPTHLTMTDVANDTYFRPTADRCTLVGRHAPEREWLSGSDTKPGDAPDQSFVAEGLRRLGRRVPALAQAPYRLGRTCALDLTPDGRPILGPEGPRGLYLATGWSGSGFGKAPAVGAELARWIVDGSPQREAMTDYSLERFRTGELIEGEHEYGGTGPH